MPGVIVGLIVLVLIGRWQFSWRPSFQRVSRVERNSGIDYACAEQIAPAAPTLAISRGYGSLDHELPVKAW
jgi:hypothetical protein